jgi:vacuolar-type H+-ATPase subunit I/STV1
MNRVRNILREIEVDRDTHKKLTITLTESIGALNRSNEKFKIKYKKAKTRINKYKEQTFGKKEAQSEVYRYEKEIKNLVEELTNTQVSLYINPSLLVFITRRKRESEKDQC